MLPPPSVGPPTLPPVASSTNDDPWTPFGQPGTPTVRPPDAPAPLPGTVRPVPTAAPRPIGGRAVIAQAMLLVAAAAAVFGTWTTWNRRSVLADVRDGNSTLTTDRADEVDRWVQIGVAAELGMLVVCGIAFIVWFHRAYSNYALFRRNERAVGWAIGSWFVPILNLFRPVQMATELTRSIPRSAGDAAPGVIWLWWSLWVAGNVIGRITWRIDANTIDGLIRSDTWSTAGGVVRVLCAFAAIGVVRHITTVQRATFPSLAR